MPTRVVENESGRKSLIALVNAQNLPFTAQVNAGRKRSLEQNATVNKWYTEIAEQIDDNTREEWRAYCKLTIGVPILREENERFRETYDRYLKPLAYEDKLTVIREMEIPVTSLMGTRQMKRYMDEIQRRFSEQGVMLTDPDELKYRDVR